MTPECRTAACPGTRSQQETPPRSSGDGITFGRGQRRSDWFSDHRGEASCDGVGSSPHGVRTHLIRDFLAGLWRLLRRTPEPAISLHAGSDALMLSRRSLASTAALNAALRAEFGTSPRSNAGLDHGPSLAVSTGCQGRRLCRVEEAPGDRRGASHDVLVAVSIRRGLPTVTLEPSTRESL